MTMTISGKYRHAGIVLAAGASSRMGTPKALLPCPSGACLADEQARLLESAGCARAVVVLGSNAERIAPRLKRGEAVIHGGWERGRLSSLQCGLRAAPGFDGYLVLPVDTAAVGIDTLRRVLARAEALAARALRPFHDGRAGFVVWISGAKAAELLAVDAGPGTRVDDLLARDTTRLDVDDPAVLNNINTPEDWARIGAVLTGQRTPRKSGTGVRSSGFLLRSSSYGGRVSRKV